MAYSFLATVDSAASASGATITQAITYTGGEAAIVAITYASGTTVARTSFVDTLGNTYTQVGSDANDVADSQSTAVYIAYNCKAGATTITVTWAAAQTFRGISASRYSGLTRQPAAQAVSQVQAAPGTGADAMTSGNLTPGYSPGLLFGFLFNESATNVVNAGTGFTSRGTVPSWPTAFGTSSLRVEDKQVTSQSPVAATGTLTVNDPNQVTFAIFAPEDPGLPDRVPHHPPGGPGVRNGWHGQSFYRTILTGNPPPAAPNFFNDDDPEYIQVIQWW